MLEENKKTCGKQPRVFYWMERGNIDNGLFE